MNHAKTFVRVLLLIVAQLVLAHAPRAQATSQDLVLAFIEAYNTQDVDEMLALVTADIRWMSVEGVRIRMQTVGKEALGSGMRGYFDNLPSARAEVRDIRQLDDFVTVVEAALWEENGVAQSQCAISVYQVSAGLISNVWYYPARQCEAVRE